jgi:hypothetical protein
MSSEYRMMSTTTYTTDTLLSEVVEAIPTPLPHHANDFMVCGILVCTFILAIVFSDRKRYLSQLLRGFFLPRENAIEGVRTTSIVYLRISMYIVGLASTALLLVIFAAGGPLSEIGDGMLWLSASAVIAVFYLLKILLFAATNRIFFDSTTISTWEHGYACWTILSGIPLYLLAVAAIFFNLPSHMILPLLSICIFLLEICLLYKAFHIFSSKKYGILQIFVYLCTLELMPLFVAGKALVLFV